ASGALGQSLLAVDLGLLAGGSLFKLAQLIGARGVAAAAIERLELAFKPRAVGVLLGLRLRRLLLGVGGRQRRKDNGGRPQHTAPSQFHCSPRSPQTVRL